MSAVTVIGSGFSGLSAAACLAKAGHDVTVYEKNSSAGGRARKFEDKGFVFDMGPSWYWMPEIFEKFYSLFGATAGEYYSLKRLDPSYRVFFSKSDIMDVPAGKEALYTLFEQREPGTAKHLKRFLEEAKYKYETGMHKLVYMPGLSITELFDPELMTGIFKLDVFKSLSAHVRKYFTDPGLIQLLEFPVLFLGASPGNTPALYSLMNYADMVLGTWYPMGGMHKIVEAMYTICLKQGVKFHFNSEVQSMNVTGTRVASVTVNDQTNLTDYVVASADYHHVEQKMLAKPYRRYSESYWQTRTLAPSSLIFYLGVSRRLKNLLHHNLFFDQDFEKHAREIYENPEWPTNPLFYVSCPSVTDSSVAPEGCENIFILIPVAAGLSDREEIRKKYFDLVIHRLESLTGQTILEHIVYSKSYAHQDFISDYHAFKGNAYGLANTLKQTANFKPSMINNKVSNLFYTGQLTVPGPGVPPAIISGQVVAGVLEKAVEREKNS
jgi:phytoene desaturase